MPQSAPHRVNTQQLAWGVLLLSFAIFCVILILVIIGANYFVFQSRVPLDAEIHVARGTATSTGTDLNDTAVKTEKVISRSSIVSTDPQSQALVTFSDPQHNDRLVANVTLKSGSSLALSEDSRPRFDLSQDAYWIEFEDVYGEIDVVVPDTLDRALLISFDTTLGPSARLTAAGRYTLSASNAQVQLINYSGEALLLASDLRNRLVPAGQSASIQAGGDDESQFVLAPLTNLAGDTSFSPANVIDFISNADQVQPQVWRCLNVQNTDPAGSFSLTIQDARPALRLFRDSGAESHGETRCLQGFGTGTEGLDVSQFQSVSIRATFKIVNQSLSTCGIDGSECPFMLRMDYIPVNGGDPVSWFHGFYEYVEPNRYLPPSCASCNEQHEQINPDTWYTYESHNLKETFTPERVPQSILNLRFYASGHEYDVYVSEVSLMVDNAEIPLVPNDG